MQKNKMCKNCNREFVPIGTQIYCSQHCKNQNKYKKRKENGYNPFYLKLRFEIFNRDNFTCQYCGRKSPDVILEIDHKFPKSKLNKNILNNKNLITACKDCNRGKGDLLLNLKY